MLNNHANLNLVTSYFDKKIKRTGLVRFKGTKNYSWILRGITKKLSPVVRQEFFKICDSI